MNVAPAQRGCRYSCAASSPSIASASWTDARRTCARPTSPYLRSLDQPSVARRGGEMNEPDRAAAGGRTAGPGNAGDRDREIDWRVRDGALAMASAVSRLTAP